jgi:cell shape-determining protein MreC
MWRPGQEGGVVPKKAIIAVVALFAVYMLMTAPVQSAGMVRDGATALLGGVETVAQSVFTFLDALV